MMVVFLDLQTIHESITLDVVKHLCSIEVNFSSNRDMYMSVKVGIYCSIVSHCVQGRDVLLDFVVCYFSPQFYVTGNTSTARSDIWSRHYIESVGVLWCLYILQILQRTGMHFFVLFVCVVFPHFLILSLAEVLEKLNVLLISLMLE